MTNSRIQSFYPLYMKISLFHGNKPILQSDDIRKLGSFKNNLVLEFSEMRYITSFKKLFSLGVSRNEI